MIKSSAIVSKGLLKMIGRKKRKIWGSMSWEISSTRSIPKLSWMWRRINRILQLLRINRISKMKGRCHISILL